MASSKCLTTSTLLLIVSCLCMGGGPYPSHARTDTFQPGQVLAYTERLTSAGGIFQLGFFQASRYFYLGLWYKDDPNPMVLWVGNRNDPIPAGTEGNFTMDADGKLMIMQNGGTPIILNSHQAAAAAQNSTATLTDSGNFVVTLDSTKRVLWQSFDYPTDTLLPVMKLGTNSQTGKKWVLTSWLSESDTAPGTFSLEWNSTSNGTGQLVMRLRGDVYWTSGSLDTQNQTFQNIPWLSNSSINDYKFSYVSNENESYFNYSVTSGRITWWMLYSTGGQFYDGNKPDFVPAEACHGYTIPSYPGCAVQKPPECRSSLQKFEQYPVRFLESGALYDKNSSLGPSDCWARCWEECSCVGFDILNPNNFTGCRFWTGHFEQDYSGASSKIFVLNSTSPDNHDILITVKN